MNMGGNMTYNEKKRYLEGYIYSVRKIKSLQRDLEQWETIATKMSQKLTQTPVKSNASRSKIEECAIRIAGIEQSLIDEIRDAEEKKNAIAGSITSIRNPRRREIIEMRYVHNVPVCEIALDFNKGEDNIYKIIRKTIKAMEI